MKKINKNQITTTYSVDGLGQAVLWVGLPITICFFGYILWVICSYVFYWL